MSPTFVEFWGYVMRHLFTEFAHKLVVAVLAVAAGIGAFWYSQTNHQPLWLMGLIGVGAALLVDLVFHPFVWLWRHRARRRVVVDDVEAQP